MRYYSTILITITLAGILALTACGKTGHINNFLVLLGMAGADRPKVVSMQPSDGSTGISRSTTVKAVFDRDMDASTITGNNVILEGGPGAITGTVAYDAATRTATFTLVSPANLEYLSEYTATITTGVRDSRGTSLSGDVTWKFTTLAEGTVPAPAFSPIAGTSDSAVDVSISCTDGSATIRYTTDGSVPSRTHGTVYAAAVHIGANTLLRAMACHNGWIDSTVYDGQYNIRASTPAFTPTAGTYGVDQSVTLVSATTGAGIYYTMTSGTIASPPYDPLDPDTGSTPYAAAMAVSGQGTVVKIKAIAVKSGMTNSTIVFGQFTIDNSVLKAKWGEAKWGTGKWNP